MGVECSRVEYLAGRNINYLHHYVWYEFLVMLSSKLFGSLFQHIKSIKYAFYNPYMVRNYLYGENNEPKPQDFLSKFLQGKD